MLDQRAAAQDTLLLASAQSYLYSAVSAARPFERLVEVPLLVPSEWYHGVQAADTVGRVVGAVFRHRLCSDPAFQWAETEFGAIVNSLDVTCGAAWRSIYMR